MTSGKPQNPSQALAALLSGGAPAKSNNIGIAAAAVLVLTLIVLALLLVPIFMKPGAGSAASAPQAINQSEAAAKFDEALTQHLAQIEGRSAFHLPLKNPKVEAPAETRNVATRYEGPQIVAMVNNAVWFSTGERIETGKSDKSGDLKVLAIDAPWSAKVRWQGGEFTVDFFQRSPLLTGKNSEWKTSFFEDSGKGLTPPRPSTTATTTARTAPPGPNAAVTEIKGEPIVIELTPEDAPHDPPPPPPVRPAPTPAPQGEPGGTPASTPEPAPAAPPAAPPAEPEKNRP